MIWNLTVAPLDSALGLPVVRILASVYFACDEKKYLYNTVTIITYSSLLKGLTKFNSSLWGEREGSYEHNLKSVV